MDVAHMDPASAKLAVQLQLDDVIEALEGVYDDSPEGDERASYETMQADLQRHLQHVEGRIMANGILKAEYIDLMTFRQLIDEEKEAVSDHQLAMQLEGMHMNDPKVLSCADYEASLVKHNGTLLDEDEDWHVAKQIYDADMDFSVKDKPPLSGVRFAKANDLLGEARKRTIFARPRDRPKGKCDACLEYYPLDDTLRLRCQPIPHLYCRNCLIDLFKAAMDDTTLFPPRCCKVAIPVETCRPLLPKELALDFDLKIEELATPNPIYCCNSYCNKFIRMPHIKNDLGRCPSCHADTCTICKGPAHYGLCPKDPSVQLLMDAAKRSKWQQCKRCNNMVELAGGCFHMTCRCTYEFCYLCGAKWKRCQCPLWEEEQLIAAGNHPLDPPAPPAPALENRIRREPCVHPHGRARIRQQACNECGDNLPFVMRCITCEYQACWRCINNRA